MFFIFAKKYNHMARPENNRLVHEPPLFNGFKPSGVQGHLLKTVTLSLDEFEAFRLADHIGLSHEEAADEMEISRPVFSKMIQRARQKVAMLIIEGKKLEIEGGNVHFQNNIFRCKSCGHMFKTSFQQTVTVCPSCGAEKLLNLAGGFGHGKCCGEHHRHRRHHHSKTRNKNSHE
ncbi:MAG: DUF134 domain-containing protein [Bacteroidales bacterium]|nr:DUF134 domain-containing protein [Bacteroidales bacterium]